MFRNDGWLGRARHGPLLHPRARWYASPPSLPRECGTRKAVKTLASRQKYLKHFELSLFRSDADGGPGGWIGARITARSSTPARLYSIFSRRESHQGEKSNAISRSRASPSIFLPALNFRSPRACCQVLRTRHTLEPLAWHWSYWHGRLVTNAAPPLALMVVTRNNLTFSSH